MRILLRTHAFGAIYVALIFYLILPIFSFSQVEAYKDFQLIRDQGFDNSNIREYAVQLTDVCGPRLTGTSGYHNACEWALQTLKSLGLANTRKETWGEFGNGWQMEKFYIAMTSPYYQPLVAVPRAWTGNTNGLEKLQVVLITANSQEELARYEGLVKGKVIITPYTEELEVSFEPLANRHTEENLSKYGQVTEFRPDADPFMSMRKVNNRTNSMLSSFDLIDFATNEGAAGVLVNSGSFGTVMSVGDRLGRLLDTLGIPIIDMTHEHYARMVRLLDRMIPVEIEMEVKNSLIKENTLGYNIFAEITGSDKSLKDEVVMIGAHIDSWHGATGGNDNASGVIVMMEVIRILKQSGIKPKRTIRLALWGGEEQGLLGSKNWAKENLFDPETNTQKAEFDRISAYYNFDYGTGKIRGIFLHNNIALKPIVEEFFKPLDDLGVRITSIRNPGSSDHVLFNNVGIPGFAFIQDRIDYGRTYHTNMDTFERIQLGDLKQAAVVVATLVLQTSNYPTKLPRRDLVP